MAQRQQFRITDFSGGLNIDQPATLIADNQASAINDFRIDSRGALVTRKGAEAYVTQLGTYPLIHGLGRWDNPTDETQSVVLAVVDDELLIFDGGGNQTTWVRDVDDTAEMFFTNVQDITVLTNGVDDPLYFDGTNDFDLGMEAPTISTATLLSGTLTGDYDFVATYYSTTTGMESGISNIVSETLSSQKVSFTAFFDADPRFDKVRWYRRSSGSGVFLLIDEVDNDNTGFTNSDAATSAVTHSDTAIKAPVMDFTAYFAGYMFGVKGQTIYWSKALNPHSWPALNTDTIPFQGNDRATGLVAHQDTLIIFGMDNTIIVTGQGGQWSMVRMDVDLGCVNNKAYVEVEGNLVFLSRQGLRLFQGFSSFSPLLDRYLAQLSYNTVVSAALTYVPEERAVWCAFSDEIYAIHLVNQGISRYTFGAAYFLKGGVDSFSYPLYADDTNLWEYGATDDIFQAGWTSKIFEFTPEKTKHFRRVGIFQSYGSTVRLTVTDEFGNSFTGFVTAAVSGSATWDESLWDTGVFVLEGFRFNTLSLPPTIKGNSLFVTLSTNPDAETQILPPITIDYRESDRFLGG